MLFLFSALVFAEDFPPAPKRATIVAVYDGDTFTLDTGDKVRLAGANTPELKPKEKFGIEARDSASRLLLNKRVELSYGAVQRDGYGRLIASVKQGEVDTATHLIEQGYAHVFLIPPETLDTKPMLEAQKRAKEAKKGLWSIDRYQSELHMTSFHANAPGDDNQNINGEYIRVCNIATEPVNLKGYYITDISGHTFEFPDLTVPAGHTFKVFSGKGTHQADPSKQLEVYLGSDRPVWNNSHDKATIYNPDNKIQDFRVHKPKSKR